MKTGRIGRTSVETTKQILNISGQLKIIERVFNLTELLGVPVELQ